MRDDRTEGLRHEVVAAVCELTPVDDVERGDVERFVADVSRLADPFDRHADPVHVTGSGFVVGERGIVLLRHLKIGTWLQPGGHLDPGETPWNAARREVVEETGMNVDFLGETPELAHVSVHDVPDGHTHLDLRYLFDGGVMDPAPPADESQDVHWFAWPAAISTAEPSLTNILRRLALRFSP
ncbi:MAG TPA: NUDIX domain-containing protein [Desertimonas sp.]|nr:NUDIX domain-containing protein [Desertimonas sp.]HET9666861.1 NUDIX domain-containing protein [Desertimonas sp.]